MGDNWEVRATVVGIALYIWTEILRMGRVWGQSFLNVDFNYIKLILNLSQFLGFIS